MSSHNPCAKPPREPRAPTEIERDVDHLLTEINMLLEVLTGWSTDIPGAVAAEHQISNILRGVVDETLNRSLYEVCTTKNDTTICSKPMKLREAYELFEYYKERGVDVVVRSHWRPNATIYSWNKKG